ncbi:MAG: MATE family efflux transporter [Gammaproteobacteria bacterium]|nr:MAG: MATE family efflux transporter [Gammaproteobacteria bacterium]RKZ70961.1 MAG: MATE family efflux transporter [Gammaproteobacteria bacterium]
MKSNLDDKILLEESPIRRLFFKYAIPSVVTVLFFGFQNIIDGIIVGNYVGSDALGGVNFILPFYSFIMVVALIIGIGCETIVSIGVGEKDISKARNAMSTGFWALLTISITLTIFLWFFAEDFTTILGADQRLLPHAMNYLKGLVPFILPIELCFYSDAMLKATGHPRFSMVIMSLTVILNIILSLFFVIQMGMGTMGASLATGLAFTIGCIVSGYITFNPKQQISMLKGKFKWKLLQNALYNGSSEGVSELASAISILVINLTMIKLVGADGVAAFTAINYINFTGVLVFLGVSDGLIPVLSYNYGAKNFKRVKSILNFAACFNAILGLSIFLVLQVFGNFIVQLFFDNNSKVITDLAAQGLFIYSFVFLINGLNVLITSFFTSIGDAKKSIVIATLRGVVFLLVGVSVFPIFGGINGVWLSIPIAEFLTFLVAFKLSLNASRKFLK